MIRQRRDHTGEQQRPDTVYSEFLTNHMIFYKSGTLQGGRKRSWREINWERGARVVTLLSDGGRKELLEGPALKQIENSKVRLLHWQHTVGARWSGAALLLSGPWLLTIIDERVNSPTEKPEGEWVPISLWPAAFTWAASENLKKELKSRFGDAESEYWSGNYFLTWVWNIGYFTPH